MNKNGILYALVSISILGLYISGCSMEVEGEPVKIEGTTGGSTGGSTGTTGDTRAQSEATGRADAKYVQCFNGGIMVYSDLSKSNLTEGTLVDARIGYKRMGESTFTMIETPDTAWMEMTDDNDNVISTIIVLGNGTTNHQITTADFKAGSATLALNTDNQNLTCTFYKDNIYAGQGGF